MEVQVEKTGACKAKLSFTVPAEEFDAEVRRALRNVGSRSRMKGFRPGKVPPQVVERQYGPQVRTEAKGHFLERALEQAARENELRLLRRPHVHDHEPLPAGQDFAMELELQLRPEIELGEVTGFEIERAPVDVTDEEIDAAIADVRQSHARPEDAGDEGLAEEGMALCKLELVLDGETVLERDGLRLSPRTPPGGVDAERFAEAMTGAAAGATLELPFQFPDPFEPHPAAAGREGTCRVKLTQVFRIVTPSDEEIREAFGAGNDEELRVGLRERIHEAKERREDQRLEEELLQRVIDGHEFELPEQMVEDQVRARLDALRRQLAEAGTEESQIEEQVAGQEGSAQAEAQKSVKAFFLIEAIGQREGLLVSDQDLAQEFRAIAERNQAKLEEVRDFYVKENLVNQLVVEILERKVRRFLRERNAPSPSAGDAAAAAPPQA